MQVGDAETRNGSAKADCDKEESWSSKACERLWLGFLFAMLTFHVPGLAGLLSERHLPAFITYCLHHQKRFL